MQSISHVNPHRGGPLQGVRVIELTKVWAGPYAGKLLAFLGAEVIKVESLNSLDTARYYGVGDINAAPGFRAVNPQKMSVQIDMKTKEGVALILDLIAKSDVVIENLRPGAVKRLGLGYEVVRAIKPDIVFVSMSMHGTTGPLSYQTGYAPAFSALSGVTYSVGYEGEAPAGMNIRYGDATFGATAVYAALVALMHRRLTGLGQFIDVAAAETMSSMIPDILMDSTLRASTESSGNRHAEMAPHGVYRCRDDEWIAIAVSSDAGWKALTRAMAQPGLAEHAAFKTLVDRKANENELNRLIAQWTATQDARELAADLQRRGVAAAKSATSIDLVSDPHLWERGFFPTIADRGEQARPIAGPSWKTTRDAVIARGAPRLGEHNAYVLGEILGLSVEEQQRLADAKVAY